MTSAIYQGTIRHRRFEVRAHRLRHRIALAYLDLDELPSLLGGRLVRRGPGLVRVRRTDLHGDPAIPAAQAVRDLVRAHTGRDPGGPVRVLTNPRRLGHAFNPVSFYYCFTPQERLAAVVAEVTNTPWGERHAYVLGAGDGAVLGGEHDKALHVSPFHDMDQRYRWRVTAPGETLSVHIETLRGAQRTFDATLALRRRPLTYGALARRPAAVARVLALIYGHALALRLRGVPVHPHPRTTSA